MSDVPKTAAEFVQKYHDDADFRELILRAEARSYSQTKEALMNGWSYEYILAEFRKQKEGV